MNDTYKTFDEITAEDIKNILVIDVERDKYWDLPIIKIDDDSYAVAANEEEASYTSQMVRTIKYFAEL